MNWKFFLNAVTDKSSVAFSVRGWVIVFACAFTLYFMTLAPDLTWQDQGDYQYQAAKCNLNRPGDVVRVHPMFIVTSHLVGRMGIMSYARAASVVSAVFTAVSVANVYLLVYLLCGQIWPAILSASTFAMAHTVWFLGVQAQTYSMANAALSGGLLLMIAYMKNRKFWLLFLMGLIFGLGISAHIMSQVGFGIIMVRLFWECLKKRISIRSFLTIILSWVAGAFLLWVVMAIEYRRSGDLAGTISSAIVGEWSSAVFNIGRLGALLKNSALFFVLNFPTPLVLLSVFGIGFSFTRLQNRTAAWLFIVCTVAYALFAVRYDIPNQNHFFIPMYMFVSIYIGLGFAFLTKKNSAAWMMITGMLLIALPPTYLGLAAYARANKIALGTRRHIPYRDVYEYYLLPWQHRQTGPRRLVKDMFERLPESSIVYVDTTTMAAILYAHEIEGQRPDIEVYRFSYKNPEIQHSSDGKVFTLSNVKHYYPKWVKSVEWLEPFAISDSENIYEIVIPSDENEL